MEAIDGCLLALTLGATFVARSFSGDKAQLVPILKAALVAQRLRVRRRHLAVRDVQRSRGLDQELRLHAREERRSRAGRLRAAGVARSPPTTSPASVRNVMLHDGSWVRLRKVAEDYDPDRPRPRLRLHPRAPERRRAGDRPAASSPDSRDLHEQSDTVDTPLTQLPYEVLCARAARSSTSCRSDSGRSYQLSADQLPAPGPFGIETGPARPSDSTPRPAWARRRCGPARTARGFMGSPARERAGGREAARS